MSGPNEVRLGLKSPMSSLSIPNRNRIAGARMRATKTSSRRAGSRSFGEYIFLEDSRYASQHKNMRRKRIYPPFALRCRAAHRDLLPRLISLRREAL
jgi:hypothetical protein